MKKLCSHGIALLTAALLFATCIAAQEKEKPQYDMGKMQMVFLTLDPAWNPGSIRNDKKIVTEHRKYVNDLIASGKCALAGSAKGDGSIYEIMVFKTESTEEIMELTKSLPAVRARMLKAEVLPWFAAKNVMKSPTIPLEFTTYAFGLLVRGSKWTPEKTPETEKIQEGHMANINRLAEAGKLVLAGPFYDEGVRRGVFIFNVESLAEAQALTDTDPAVKAERLKIELYQWVIPKGILK